VNLKESLFVTKPSFNEENIRNAQFVSNGM
jgi:hypothetical protein